MSIKNSRRRKRIKAELEAELAKLEVYIRRQEADMLYYRAVTNETIRGWKNQRWYVV